ncbi:hypothetical protein ACFL0T_07505 [Candidatus Omnitrophota bacterium]
MNRKFVSLVLIVVLAIVSIQPNAEALRPLSCKAESSSPFLSSKMKLGLLGASLFTAASIGAIAYLSHDPEPDMMKRKALFYLRNECLAVLWLAFGILGGKFMAHIIYPLLRMFFRSKNYQRRDIGTYILGKTTLFKRIFDIMRIPYGFRIDESFWSDMVYDAPKNEAELHASVGRIDKGVSKLIPKIYNIAVRLRMQRLLSLLFSVAKTRGISMLQKKTRLTVGYLLRGYDIDKISPGVRNDLMTSCYSMYEKGINVAQVLKRLRRRLNIDQVFENVYAKAGTATSGIELHRSTSSARLADKSQWFISGLGISGLTWKRWEAAIGPAQSPAVIISSAHNLINMKRFSTDNSLHINVSVHPETPNDIVAYVTAALSAIGQRTWPAPNNSLYHKGLIFKSHIYFVPLNNEDIWDRYRWEIRCLRINEEFENDVWLLTLLLSSGYAIEPLLDLDFSRIFHKYGVYDLVGWVSTNIQHRTDEETAELPSHKSCVNFDKVLDDHPKIQGELRAVLRKHGLRAHKRLLVHGLANILGIKEDSGMHMSAGRFLQRKRTTEAAGSLKFQGDKMKVYSVALILNILHKLGIQSAQSTASDWGVENEFKEFDQITKVTKMGAVIINDIDNYSAYPQEQATESDEEKLTADWIKAALEGPRHYLRNLSDIFPPSAGIYIAPVRMPIDTMALRSRASYAHLSLIKKPAIRNRHGRR